MIQKGFVSLEELRRVWEVKPYIFEAILKHKKMNYGQLVYYLIEHKMDFEEYKAIDNLYLIGWIK